MSDFTRPEHHIHSDSQPLPGQRGAAPTADYSPDTMECAPDAALDSSNINHQNAALSAFAHTDSDSMDSQNAFNSEHRPPAVQPVPDRGVVVGDESESPMGHAKLGDKVVGKTQKVIGKYTNNPELREKGELREVGGKAAVFDEARAHD